MSDQNNDAIAVVNGDLPYRIFCDRAQTVIQFSITTVGGLIMEGKIISLRVRANVAQALERAARARRMTKSRLILESLEAVLKNDRQKSTYALGEDLFGRHGSGRRDTSTRHRKLYREYVGAKRARR